MTDEGSTRPQGLRIAVNAFSTAVGGGRRHLLRILPRMFELGRSHVFTVFVSPSLEREFRSQHHPNVVWKSVGFDGLETRKRLLWENAVFPIQLHRGGYDVVFCNANLSHFVGSTPRVIVLHNSFPFYPELHAGEDAKMKRRLLLLRWGSHHFIRRAEGTVFLSHRGRTDALKGTHIVPRDEIVVYHGVDAGFGTENHAGARAEIGARHGAPDGYVLYVSHFYRYKKFEALFEAWGRVPRAALAGRKLLIAGEPHDASYTVELSRIVRKLGLVDDVRFLGGVPVSELSLLHAGADVVAFMSVCENCPISVLEALASGRPVLLSSRSVMPELGADTALYADPDRPDEVAGQLQRLLTDRVLADDLGKRARARMAPFTWDASARGVLELLERVGARGRGGRERSGSPPVTGGESS